jgi:hypothetical protein
MTSRIVTPEIVFHADNNSSKVYRRAYKIRIDLAGFEKRRVLRA